MPAITNVNELQAMENDLAGNYWLANDIDASATVEWNGEGFAPISDFEGTFDGKGYEILSLYINRPTEDIGLCANAYGATLKNVSFVNPNIIGGGQSWYCIGVLAGYLYGCTVEDVKVINATISNTKGIYVGGLAGMVDKFNTTKSSLERCSTSGHITSPSGNFIGGLAGGFYQESSAVECSSSIDIDALPDGYYAAGLIGHLGNDSTTAICFATGSVKAKRYAAGFCSYISAGGTITDCYEMGDVLDTQVDAWSGGFVADIYDTLLIKNCYSKGKVTSNSPHSGGFCGYNGTGTEATFVACFWDIQTSDKAEGIGRGTLSEGVVGRTTGQMQTKATFTDADWDFIIIWAINRITNDGYPFFFAMPPEPTPDAPRETVAVQDKITLECVRNVEMAAGGRFYINEEGKATYKSRYARNA